MDLTDDQILALSEHREESWRYDLLNLQDQKIGQLDGVTGATFEWSIFTDIRTSGSMDCVDPDIDWLSVRVQPWATVVAAGMELSWPVGVFIPATPGTQYSGAGKSQAIDLYDKLQILVDDKVENTYSVAAGTVVTTFIKTMLAGVGEVRDAITPSAATLRTSMVWEADTTKLKIINDLLASINYFSLWVDGYGVFQGAPYVEPGSRGISWIFADGAQCIYSSDFFHNNDGFLVPNKVSLISTSDGETAALTAQATNENPESDYSYQKRGRWITTTEKDIEASDQSTLNLMAQRRLIELSDVSSTYDISHALIPLDLNAAVKFIRSTEGILETAVIQKMSFGTEVGGLVRTTIRAVAL